jgi:hypothetical protein
MTNHQGVKETSMASPTASPGLTKHDLESRLIQKCWKEPEFRTQVLADPKGTFERHLGRPLPADLKIVIHEEDAKTLHFALPPPPVGVTELSDEELEKVAGGTEVVGTVLLTIGVATASAAVGLTVGVGLTKGW